jgi:hypothetical protein
MKALGEAVKPGDFLIVTDLATGEVLRVETVLTDGRRALLYPLTREQIEEFKAFLEQPSGC